jgi:6-phosphogluconolactonase
VFIANYNDGNVAVLPILPNGSLAAPSQVITHAGQGPNTDRQECAHAHCVALSPDDRFLIACDLGTDKVTTYAYDEDNQQQPLNPVPVSIYQAKPGTGPRHIIFSADGKFAYLVGELTAVVIVFEWNNGVLTELQQIDMMPADFKGDNCAADIHLSPDGNFLYTSNRGAANQLIIYAVDKATGLLTLKGRQSTLGTGPRNFAIDPSGQLLLVANQVSNDAQLFNVDKFTGMLSFKQSISDLQAPVFVKFI